MHIGRRIGLVCLLVGAGAGLWLAVAARPGLGAGQARLLAWNDVGMHEMEANYAVYAVQPPGNNLRAQLVDATGHLVKLPADVTVTYEAVADPAGSINTSSVGKTGFWSAVQSLYGHQPAPDTGLQGSAMPGAANVPQPMHFDAAHAGWAADGIPITRIDDAGHRNAYPLLRVTARDGTGAALASADVVVPVSDELSCKTCHASNSVGAARPEDGWVNDPDPERDYRLNVLRRHDDRHLGEADYTAGLAASGYLPTGLYDTVITAKQPVLCTKCHAGNGPDAAGRTDTSTLSRAMHRLHATVTDPGTGRSLNSTTDRSACYTCHPGAETQHLRGAMGHSVALDGALSMQCQSCHGAMQALAGRDRQPWKDLPTCQSCHTGHALSNSGELRFTSSFDVNGKVRMAADPIFASNPDTPAVGLSLYRESTGHGGLACAACHGTTHAEYPSRGGNDDVQAVALQGHGGTVADCQVCHSATLNTVTGGPHTMHPVDQNWVRRHSDAAERGAEGCQTCHGADYSGTVLSRALGERTFQVYGQPVTYWQGYQVGCSNCHDGPRSEHRSTNSPAVTQDAALVTDVGRPVGTDLQATDADGDALTLRIVSQTLHGTVALADRHAIYQPAPGFNGADQFTFAAWDGRTDSNLGTVRIQVGAVVVPTATTSATVLPPTVPANPTPSASPTPFVGGVRLYLPAALTGRSP
jgi:hypothetical protein